MGQSQHGREEGVRLPHRYLAVQSIATHLSSAGGDAPCGAAPSATAPPPKKKNTPPFQSPQPVPVPVPVPLATSSPCEGLEDPQHPAPSACAEACPTARLCGAMKYIPLIHHLIIGCLFIVCLL